ncbi:YafY family transcriptional regulator [Clostridium sp. YIM B02505]|uniref:YafY family transcriptional regulator n=1 Tax=Clostridium yunnanense TaxID=2800325 RepID=A0ABS1ETP0_9CLOT|nr:YafY family protein [Clostridium yunnanense]MBK1812732.1 YafY family transcriptional regulator [Clostridium yunnanense]
MKSNRLFEILMLLLDKRKVTSTELAKKFEVSVRTIYRDVEALSSAGIPIYTTTGKNGGIHLMDNYVLDKSVISNQEQDDILFAIQSLGTVPNLSRNDIYNKLSVLFSPNIKNQESNWLEVDFSGWHSSSNKETELFLQLKKAITTQRVIQLQYISDIGVESTRTVDPLRLLFKYKDWYLYGYCKIRRDFRLFKLFRINHCEILPQKADSYNRIPKPYINDYINQEALIHMELLFNIRAAGKVYENFNHQLIYREDENQLRVSGKLEKNHWFLSLLLSFGPDVFVEKPLSIREDLIKLHMKAINHFLD